MDPETSPQTDWLWWAAVPYTLAVPVVGLLIERLTGASGWALAHGGFAMFLLAWFPSSLLSMVWVLRTFYRISRADAAPPDARIKTMILLAILSLFEWALINL
jgi:hypothetical protein